MRSQQIRKLVERILGSTFVDWVQPRRDRGDSWDDISAELSTFLDVKISRETVRRWYSLP